MNKLFFFKRESLSREKSRLLYSSRFKTRESDRRRKRVSRISMKISGTVLRTRLEVKSVLRGRIIFQVEIKAPHLYLSFHYIITRVKIHLW